MKANKSSLFISKWTTSLLGPKNNYRLRYYHQRGHFPNLTHPQDMSEILINRLFDRTFCNKISKFVDKIKVRDYIREKGLGNILLKHYGEWEKPEQINFDLLPDKFILKANNGCGNHYICRNKAKIDCNKAINILNKSLLLGKNHVEQHYHFIDPKVFCEELIDTGSQSLPIDYKFTCINGEIVDIFVACEREINAKYCTLDTDWQVLPYTKQEYLPEQIPKRPKHLSDLIDVAKQLGKDFAFVRVDLYEYRDQPYFSELTFFPWGGLLYSYTDEAIKKYGAKFRGDL